MSTARQEFKLGQRVRLQGTSGLGSIFAVPYEFRGVRKAGVIWDDNPKWVLSVKVDLLVLATADDARGLVPPEARPYSVGALQHPMRGSK